MVSLGPQAGHRSVLRQEPHARNEGGGMPVGECGVRDEDTCGAEPRTHCVIHTLTQARRPVRAAPSGGYRARVPAASTGSVPGIFVGWLIEIRAVSGMSRIGMIATAAAPIR